MTKRSLSTLVFILSSLYASTLLADRPAAYDEMTTPESNTEQPIATDDARPAADDTKEVIDVTEQSGDVLGMPTEQLGTQTVSVR
ncbi:MAG: hypothetical protein OQK72_10160, partial [Gammaproteobacteria bacterium]|nr:hypothetical protein [Gammaproteobacteria bacterium]